MAGFSSPLDALGAAVEVTRVLLARHLLGVASRRDPEAPVPRASASAAEVARLLAGATTPAEATRALGELAPAVDKAWAAFRARLAGSPSAPLAVLASRFGLGDRELALVAVLAALEHDPELERSIGFATGDPLRRRPDVGLLVQLLAGPDPVAIGAALDALDGDRPLRRLRLVQLAAPDLPMTLRPIRLADRVVAHLRGRASLDEALEGWAGVAAPPPIDELVVAAPLVAAVRRALADPAPRLLLHGPDGTGKATLAAAAAAERGLAALRVDLDALLADPGALGERLAIVAREAALRGAAVILELAGRLDEPRVEHGLTGAIAARLGALPLPIVLAFAHHPATLAAHLPDLVELAVAKPTFAERIALWRRALAGVVLEPEDAIEKVAGRYGFGAPAIRRAARRATAAAALREPGATRVTLDDLGEAARMMFHHRLGASAQRIPPGFTWDDLVLPDETVVQLQEIVRFAHLRPFLLEDWGFAKKLPYGRGVSVILAGPPGTGKTMLAQLLAREIGFELYRIDLSQVVNKYIGETEKNLARIFDEAEDSHAVLFFDEADALFAKRTEVRSSNDRYANLEVNFLLQRMETYDGVTILATNLEQGLDEAFKRRVRFSVQLELPDVAERERLWRSMFPKETPVAPNIDWSALAERFEMAGGYIKKAALRAALAAAETRPPRAITTADLLAAAVDEYRAMGRLAAH